MSQDYQTTNYEPLLILKAKAEVELRRRKSLNKDNRLSYYEWLKETTPAYNWDWPHLVYVRKRLEVIIDGLLNGFKQGQKSRLIIQMPPRHGKSSIGTIRLPAYLLEQNPKLRIISGAYNQDLADNFSRQTRRIASSRMKLAIDRNAAGEWETPYGGGMRAAGVGCGITGFGANLGLIDDPVKSREEANSPTFRDRVYNWYTDDFYTRLEPGAAIILIMTRWQVDDLAGRILQSDDGPNWEVINLPALAEKNDPLGRVEGEALCPERYDVAKLHELRQVLGASFQSLYQQRPSAVEGAIFKREYWQYYKVAPTFNLRVLSIDTAFKAKKQNDYSVINFYGKTNTASYMVDRWKARVEYPELKRAVIECANNFKPHEILIEDKASGQSLIQELRRGTNLPIKPVQVDTDKVARANASVGFIEAGKLLLPESAPWLLDYLDTMAAFPNGAHDDDIDATAQFLSRHGFRTVKKIFIG